MPAYPNSTTNAYNDFQMGNMNVAYQTPDPNRQHFARTNAQTIAQRIVLLKELVPAVNTIAEICCGDCLRQYQAYRKQLGIQVYHGLDIDREIVVANQNRGIACYYGDALDKDNLRTQRSLKIYAKSQFARLRLMMVIPKQCKLR